MPPRNTMRPYSPPRYLLSTTGLSHDELLSQYEAFLNSLQLVEAAPELVFERIIGNLAAAFDWTLAQERIQRVPLQSALVPPTMELSHVERRTNPHLSEPVEDSAPAVLPDVTTCDSAAKEIYLQFWFPTSSTEPEKGKVTRLTQASTTTMPVPYALAICAASDQRLDGSILNGTYDSRIDSSITSPTIPSIIFKVIEFNHHFSDTPQVAVWLTGLSASTGAVVSIEVTATNVTTTKFILQIDSSAGDQLLSVGTAWAVWNLDEMLGVDSQLKVHRRTRVKISHSVWTLQHAAVSGVNLVLQPDQCVILDVSMLEYRDNTKFWHYQFRLGEVSEASGTMVTVMRRS